MSAPDFGFTSEHIADFTKRGLTPEQASEAGVRAVYTEADLPAECPDYWTAEVHPADDDATPVEWAYLPGRLYKHVSVDGSTVEYQLKPDRPQVNPVNGRAKKYLFRKGAASVLASARHVDDTGPMVVIEGTHQPIVGAAYAPAEMSVYGIAGAQSWFKHGLPTNDLFVADGRSVYICLDADAGTNDKVYNAGLKLAANLEVCGASSIRFIRLGDLTGGTNGLDDYLGNIPEGRRTRAFEGLIGRTDATKPIDKPHLPSRKIPVTTAASDEEPADPNAIFTDKGKLRTKTASRVVRENFPCMLTAQMNVAVYRKGVFKIDKLAFRAAVHDMLDERSSPAHRSTIEEYTEADLYHREQYLPNTIDQPLVNLPNGMLDMRTMELLPHDPAYMSNVQFPVNWNPDAKCPYYEEWIIGRCGGQVDALEELMSFMLDPSRTPQVAIFLYGDGGTGKGTFMRIAQALAGHEHVSSESLHGLVTGQFSVAELYGKVLNVGGDLESGALEDVAMFKQVTGGDPLPGNKKYGDKFTFYNRALLIFGLNKVMVISEDSNAFARRSRPFLFTASFAGAEDEAVEKRLMTELEGILVRWVMAWRRRWIERGGREHPVDPLVQLDFELRTDKVRRFLVHCLDVVETDTDTCEDGATQTQLFRAYTEFSDEERSGTLQQGRFIDRLRRYPGIRDVRFGEKRTRGFNVRIRSKSEWGMPEPGQMDVPGVSTTKINNSANPLVTAKRADRADVEGKLSIGGEKVYPQDQLEDIPSRHSGGEVAQNLPDLPATTAKHVPEPRSGSDLIDQLLLGAHVEPDPCDGCGTALVLVEPHRAWYACPQCHPATTRHSERTNLS